MSGRYSFVALAVILCMVGVNGQISHGQCNRPSTQAMPGQYVPQCTGLFDIIQTNPSTGYRWCVNPITGVKVEGTDVAPGNSAKPECPKCLYDLANAVINGVMWDIDGMTPECDANGNFKSHQINPNHPKYSWCVNITTGDILTTFDNPGLADCDGLYRQKRGLHFQSPYFVSSCNAERDATPTPGAYVPAEFKPKPGDFVPQCTILGFYKMIQSNPSTGYSWCVDSITGNKVDSTEVGPGKTPTCSKCYRDLSWAVMKAAVLGSDTPTCDSETGKYNALQTSDNYTWCADPETRAVIKGTKFRFGEGPAQGFAKCD